MTYQRNWASPSANQESSQHPTPDTERPLPHEPGDAHEHAGHATNRSAGAETGSPLGLKDRALAMPARTVLRWAIASMVVLAIGSVGPWATATVFGITVSASGLRGGGWVTLVTALVGFMILLDPRWASRAGWLYARRRGLWSALLWISVIVCGLNLFSVESYGLAGVVQPGWGLYPAFFASLGGLAADWVLRSQARVSSATRS